MYYNALRMASNGMMVTTSIVNPYAFEKVAKQDRSSRESSRRDAPWFLIYARAFMYAHITGWDRQNPDVAPLPAWLEKP